MADGITSLASLNWGTSTGGAAGSGETTLTLGVNRQDSRTPIDLTRIWAAQINAIENLCLSMSAFFKGGTRLQVLTQASNPFGVSESGYYIDTTGKFWGVYNGTPTQLTGGGGGGTQAGTTTASHVPYASSGNTLSDGEMSFTSASHTYSVASTTVIDWSASTQAWKTPTATGTLGGNLSANGFITYTGTQATVPPTITWTAPTFLNSWVNFGAPFRNCGYYKDAQGFVHLRGVVKSGTTATSTIFTLPAGFRPAATAQFNIQSGGAAQGLNVDSGGNVAQGGGASSTTSVVLDGIEFYAEQ